MVQYDPLSLFDEEINRREVPALKVHPMVVGPDGENLFAAGVADMDFKAHRPCLKPCKSGWITGCSGMKRYRQV